MDTKQLKQKILDLAIRGKLVPQDPNDEPASVLLERIRAEKEQLIAQGKLKKSKSKISDKPHYENVPFEIPESWEWTRVKEISSSILYGVSESAKSNGKYKLLRITDIQDNKVNWETVPYTDFDEKKVSAYILKDNDILFARTGATVGKSYLVQNLSDLSIYASYLIRVQTSKEILPRYIKYYFESGYYWEQISDSSVGTGQPNVNGALLGELNIPLPPLAEQQRIVAEVEKWFAIIDALEANKEDLKDYIKQVKSKVLSLAISGKLVPQDPNDEPAIELLKRINPSFKPCDTSHYENLPAGWSVVQLCDIAKTVTGSTPSKNNKSYYGGTFPLYKPSDLDAGRNVNEASEYLSEEGKRISRIIPANSIAVCCIGSIGKCGYIMREGTTNQQINTIIPLYNIYPLYIYYFCLSASFVQQLLEKSSAVTIAIVNKSKLDSTFILLPPLAEQKRIAEQIETIFASLDTITAEL